MAYSKSRVDRAGQSLIDLLLADNQTIVERLVEFQETIEILDWWRGEHAKPLSRVAANLRHYASQEGKPVVAQRLKKAPTIADKLVREPQDEALTHGRCRRCSGSPPKPRLGIQSGHSASQELDNHQIPRLRGRTQV